MKETNQSDHHHLAHCDNPEAYEAPEAIDEDVNKKLSLAKRIPGLGIVLCIIGTVVITVSRVMVKQMTRITPMQFMFYRALFMTLMLLPGPSVRPSVCPSSPSVRPSSPSVRLSVCPSVRLSVHLSVRPSVQSI